MMLVYPFPQILIIFPAGCDIQHDFDQFLLCV